MAVDGRWWEHERISATSGAGRHRGSGSDGRPTRIGDLVNPTPTRGLTYACLLQGEAARVSTPAAASGTDTDAGGRAPDVHFNA